MSRRRSIVGLLLSLWVAVAGAAETLPPAPTRYFNDYAGVVPAAQVDSLNRKLEEFERASSCQVVVAVFPKMESASSLEDYTHRLATAWKIGQQRKNNGVGLFVFVQERRLRIEVGYGLEGALPDALAKRIVEDEIKPFFRSGDYAGGLGAGVDAILKAVRGEYQGTGRTVAERAALRGIDPALIMFLAWIALLITIAVLNQRLRGRGTVYHRGGSSYWGSGGFSGGGGGGFSSGGFSGGGGSFGGGGASGSW